MNEDKGAAVDIVDRPVTDEAVSMIFAASGPGDPELVSLRAARFLSEATLVFADVAAVAIAEAFVPPERVIPVDPDQPGAAADRIKPAIDAMKRGERVVRLLSGDPALGSSLIGEVGAVRRAKLDVEIVPAVSVITGVPTYAGFGLIGGKAREVRILDVQDSGIDWENLASDRTTVVFPDGEIGRAHV